MDFQARKKLEDLIHPIVAADRDRIMEQAAGDAQVKAYVWDTPLLFEAGLHEQCDAIVFVEAPALARVERVKRSRGWDEQELARRENLQVPLDKKREMSHHTIVNTADAAEARRQVRQVLSRILAEHCSG